MENNLAFPLPTVLYSPTRLPTGWPHWRVSRHRNLGNVAGRGDRAEQGMGGNGWLSTDLHDSSKISHLETISVLLMITLVIALGLLWLVLGLFLKQMSSPSLYMYDPTLSLLSFTPTTFTSVLHTGDTKLIRLIWFGMKIYESQKPAPLLLFPPLFNVQFLLNHVCVLFF